LEASRNGRLCAGALEYENNLNIIETVVDKIRYAGDTSSERTYIKELLSLFAADSGRFTYNVPKNSS